MPFHRAKTISSFFLLVNCLFSGPQEEQSVRAIFALNQEKVLNDYLLSQEGDANVDEIEAEYNHMCNQVVS